MHSKSANLHHKNVHNVSNRASVASCFVIVDIHSFIHVVYSPADLYRPYQGCHRVSFPFIFFLVRQSEFVRMTKMICTFLSHVILGFCSNVFEESYLFNELQDRPRWDVPKQSSYRLSRVVFVPCFVEIFASN